MLSIYKHVSRAVPVVSIYKAKNRRHATRPNSIDWMLSSWENLKEESIRTTAGKLHMTPEPGESVEGYVSEHEDVSNEDLDENEY